MLKPRARWRFKMVLGPSRHLVPDLYLPNGADRATVLNLSVDLIPIPLLLVGGGICRPQNRRHSNSKPYNAIEGATRAALLSPRAFPLSCRSLQALLASRPFQVGPLRSGLLLLEDHLAKSRPAVTYFTLFPRDLWALSSRTSTFTLDTWPQVWFQGLIRPLT